jgi:hypothetical protein
MKDKRQAQGAPDIDPRLIAEGTAQLAGEIEILETWLADLKKADPKDPQVAEARTSYLDMLRSRREMLSTLKQAIPTEASADSR